MQEQQDEQTKSRWQKIGTQGEFLSIDAKKWAAVIDNKTEMMWAINPTKTAKFPNPKSMLSWHEAMAWLDQVNSQGWCGFHDWQLPDIFELKTLIMINKEDGIFIDKHLFKDINTSRVCNSVWSSSSSSNIYAWVVSFDQGREFTCLKENARTVRLVRYIRQDIPTRWQKIGLQGEKLIREASEWAAAIDTKNKLMWAINQNKTIAFPNPKRKLTWDEAKVWVEDVNIQGWCGYHNWRLPNIDELKTLITKVEYPKFFIDEDIFDDIKYIKERMYLYNVWSSSSFDSWIGGVKFEYGTANYWYQASDAYLRLVRSTE